jgi:hypothetical protein
VCCWWRGWWVWMVVRFVCAVRVPLCVRVSRVCPGSPRCLFTGMCPRVPCEVCVSRLTPGVFLPGCVSRVCPGLPDPPMCLRCALQSSLEPVYCIGRVSRLLPPVSFYRLPAPPPCLFTGTYTGGSRDTHGAHGTRGRTKAHRRISQPTKPTNFLPVPVPVPVTIVTSFFPWRCLG